MFKLLKDLLIYLADFIEPYRDELVMAITASLLMLYGDVFVVWIKKHIRKHHFVLRVTIFVLISAFGIVLVDTLLQNTIISFLDSGIISKALHFPFFCGIFIWIGILAERKKQI